MSPTRAAIIAGFAAAVVAVGVLEWRARRPGSHLPTLGEVCRFVLGCRVGRLPVGRIALLGLWWWIGWHFFAR
jgi:hypothetical protein